ncbi:QueT transporter family protein [Hutsoniella sourekii]|uniref:QueT transporter family protein n=1 Tax=Hutsoniella sourekii TaxID=87650 RepID=UPI0004B7CB80|nr:QueT transporter family protein [Hutsoniella sourekii]
MTQKEQFVDTTAFGLTRTALVAALYVALTFLIAPLGFGAVQFRISEALNYLGLFHKRYVTAIALGVFIVNAILSTPLDVVVGTFHTLVSLLLGRYLAKQLANKYQGGLDPLLIQFIVMALTFTATMFIIAIMLVHIGVPGGFWFNYGTLALSEFIAMGLGALIMYPLAKRINFYQ